MLIVYAALALSSSSVAEAPVPSEGVSKVFEDSLSLRQGIGVGTLLYSLLAAPFFIPQPGEPARVVGWHLSPAVPPSLSLAAGIGINAFFWPALIGFVTVIGTSVAAARASSLQGSWRSQSELDRLMLDLSRALDGGSRTVGNLAFTAGLVGTLASGISFAVGLSAIMRTGSDFLTFGTFLAGLAGLIYSIPLTIMPFFWWSDLRGHEEARAQAEAEAEFDVAPDRSEGPQLTFALSPGGVVLRW